MNYKPFPHIVLKSAFFGPDQTFGIAVRINEGLPDQKGYATSFPSNTTAKEMIQKLREIANWIEKETK